MYRLRIFRAKRSKREKFSQKFLDGSDPYVYPNVNWKDEVFRNTANETNAYISMYGGTDKVQYYSLLDYTDARGLYANPDQGDWNSQLKTTSKGGSYGILT